MELTFILATLDHLEPLVRLYASAIENLNNHGIPQWDELYPTKEILEEDIKKKQLYLGMYKNQIVSSYVLNEECDAAYNSGDWQYPHASYRIVHRLCVSPLFQHHQVGFTTMLYIEDVLRKCGVQTIRLDTFSLNPYALKLYEKLSYHKVGTAQWRKGTFYLMEKKL